ncbi:MAG: dipeptidase [Deltaproteobacteria bacterium]|nr:dipeptidase [Deltaproteobacteria bacterium]
MQRTLIPLLLLPLLSLAATAEDFPSEVTLPLADFAVDEYGQAAVETLQDLVKFKTVYEPGTPNSANPEFQAMTAYLEKKAKKLGFDFADHGEVVVIGMGNSTDRLGIITHGDVQPADPSKWTESPFFLDTQSEPGKFIARGAEDDKGPIALALYAMKALSDTGMELRRRIELTISYTEESNWQPFQAFLEENPPPQINVALDAQYPVVIAEKGFGGLRIPIPATKDTGSSRKPRLEVFTGGAFLTQIPEDARAEISRPTAKLERRLLAAARSYPNVEFRFTPGPDSLTIEARGKAAHSSEPWAGQNALSHLAAVLGVHRWPDSQAARAVRFANDLVGLGHNSELFGDSAYSHPFMGPMTLSWTLLEPWGDDALRVSLNFRRPVGRSGDQVETSFRTAFDAWKKKAGYEDLEVEVLVSDPHYTEDAPHVPVLLDIFEHFTGQKAPKALSIGGGTHARLVPNGVNFGPSMPGEDYTGHTEHEFLTIDQFALNLKMYAAMLAELAARQ